MLTGDIHTSWANDLQEDPFTNTDILGVEFVTPSVTAYAIPVKPLSDRLSEELIRLIPHMHHVDLYYYGYVLLDIQHEAIQAEWHYARTINKPDADCFFAKAFRNDAGQPGLYEVFEASPAKPSARFAPVLSPLKKVP